MLEFELVTNKITVGLFQVRVIVDELKITIGRESHDLTRDQNLKVTAIQNLFRLSYFFEMLKLLNLRFLFNDVIGFVTFGRLFMSSLSRIV